MSEKQTTWTDLRGILKDKTNGKVVTIEEMNEAIADAWAEAGMAGITPVRTGRPIDREAQPPLDDEEHPAPDKPE